MLIPDRPFASLPMHLLRCAAFTLVEVLVALVVLGVIAGMLGQVLRGSLRLHTLQREQAAGLETGREEAVLQLAGELDIPVVTLEEVEPE